MILRLRHNWLINLILYSFLISLILSHRFEKTITINHQKWIRFKERIITRKRKVLALNRINITKTINVATLALFYKHTETDSCFLFAICIDSLKAHETILKKKILKMFGFFNILKQTQLEHPQCGKLYHNEMVEFEREMRMSINSHIHTLTKNDILFFEFCPHFLKVFLQRKFEKNNVVEKFQISINHVFQCVFKNRINKKITRIDPKRSNLSIRRKNDNKK